VNGLADGAAFGARAKQQPAELRIARSEVARLRPRVFVEIGSDRGGSLYAYAAACASGASIVSIDDGVRPGRKYLKRTLRRLRQAGHDARWVRADSQSAEALAAVKTALAGRPIGFLHVDGCHEARAVLADWRAYGPLVGTGGLIAFHDIADPKVGVYEAWSVIKTEATCYVEIVAAPCRKEGPYGVGLVYP
jgi:cephalosporin hydroxylase